MEVLAEIITAIRAISALLSQGAPKVTHQLHPLQYKVSNSRLPWENRNDINIHSILMSDHVKDLNYSHYPIQAEYYPR